MGFRKRVKISKIASIIQINLKSKEEQVRPRFVNIHI